MQWVDVMLSSCPHLSINWHLGLASTRKFDEKLIFQSKPGFDEGVAPDYLWLETMRELNCELATSCEAEGQPHIR
jgi:hypothetical protein